MAEALVQEQFQLEQTTGLTHQHTRGRSSFRFQEETITETLLARTQWLFPDVVSVEMFDRKSENRVGADWLWLLNFGAVQLPMLVQAKKMDGIWHGQRDWTIRITQSQRARLEKTAAQWNVASVYVVYAPSPEYYWDFLNPTSVAFLHLIASRHVTRKTGRLDSQSAGRQMIPFQDLCCAATSAEEAATSLGVADRILRPALADAHALTAADLVDAARGDRNIRGVAVFRIEGRER